MNLSTTIVAADNSGCFADLSCNTTPCALPIDSMPHQTGRNTATSTAGGKVTYAI